MIDIFSKLSLVLPPCTAILCSLPSNSLEMTEMFITMTSPHFDQTLIEQQPSLEMGT